MKRVYVPGSGLTWTEKLDIRKAALKAAVRADRGVGGTPEILARAEKFEKYLLGDTKKLDT